MAKHADHTITFDNVEQRRGFVRRIALMGQNLEDLAQDIDRVAALVERLCARRGIAVPARVA